MYSRCVAALNFCGLLAGDLPVALPAQPPAFIKRV